MIRKALISEFIGTFALVFCGTGAIVINDTITGSIGTFGIAFTFGAIVSAMIYAFGNISGAHINPAVTFSFWIAGKFEKRQIIPYLLVQFSGAITASLLLHFIFPTHNTLGTTLPYQGIWSAFIFEIVLSYILMLVIIMFSEASDNVKPFAGLAIGLVVMLEAAFAGPFTGASMNPARSFGPAIISGNVIYLGHYIIAAFLGMTLSILTWKIIKDD